MEDWHDVLRCCQLIEGVNTPNQVHAFHCIFFFLVIRKSVFIVIIIYKYE